MMNVPMELLNATTTVSTLLAITTATVTLAMNWTLIKRLV